LKDRSQLLAMQWLSLHDT